MSKNTIFERRNNLIEEIVVADGIGRSGKVFVCHVIAAMKRVEKQVNAEFFEYIPILYDHNKISEDAAVTLMRSLSDIWFNNNMICRDVNMRFQDYTGLYKNPFWWKYIKRLFLGDHKDVVRRIKKERPIFHMHVHDGLRTFQFLDKTFGDRLKLIYMIRDPVDLIYEWIRSDFGKRIGKDPTEFQLTVKYKDGVVPYTAIGWEEEYLKISPEERVVKLIYEHFTKNLDNYRKLTLDQKKRICFVCFESIVTDPYPSVKKMEEFLNAKTVGRKVRKVLRRERAPRILDLSERARRIKIIEGLISPKYRKIMHELIHKYDSKYWRK